MYDVNDKHDDTQLTPGNWYRFTAFLGKMPEYSMSINRYRTFSLLLSSSLLSVGYTHSFPRNSFVHEMISLDLREAIIYLPTFLFFS